MLVIHRNDAWKSRFESAVNLSADCNSPNCIGYYNPVHITEQMYHIVGYKENCQHSNGVNVRYHSYTILHIPFILSNK